MLLSTSLPRLHLNHICCPITFVMWMLLKGNILNSKFVSYKVSEYVHLASKVWLCYWNKPQKILSGLKRKSVFSRCCCMPSVVWLGRPALYYPQCLHWRRSHFRAYDHWMKKNECCKQHFMLVSKRDMWRSLHISLPKSISWPPKLKKAVRKIYPCV